MTLNTFHDNADEMLVRANSVGQRCTADARAHMHMGLYSKQKLIIIVVICNMLLYAINLQCPKCPHSGL